MNTDRLIEMLSTNLEPVKGGRVWRTLVWALVVGLVAAFVVMFATVGVRSDFDSETHRIFMALKLLFTLSLIGTGAVFLIRSMSPGRASRKLLPLVLVPFLVIGLAGVAALALAVARSESCTAMMMGMRWQTCLLCIPFFAIIPFAALIWALRQGAPTNLTRAGAIAGLVAGALGATAYAFHCGDDSLPFIAIWYGGSIALCTFIGAMLGPKLLRW